MAQRGRKKGCEKTPGSGRKKSTPNKRTKQRDAAMKEAAAKIAKVIPGAFKGDSHALLIAVYKDPDQPMPIRIDAAKAAIGYEKPRLAAVEMSGELGLHLKTQEEAVAEMEKRRQEAQERRKAFVAGTTRSAPAQHANG